MALKGSCHCKATQFEVSEAPASVTHCTCSFCSKRGALWAYYVPKDFRLMTARDRVSTYQWGSYTVQHHHCAICGCGTQAAYQAHGELEQARAGTVLPDKEAGR